MVKITEQDLKDYRQLKKEVKSLGDQILELERMKGVAKVPKPKTSSSSGFKNTAEDNLIRLESAKVKLNTRLNEYLEKLEEVDEFIGGLKTSLERNIFTIKYIDGLNWEHVAVRVELTSRQARRIHDKCLGFLWVRDENGKYKKVSDVSQMSQKTR